MGIYLRAQITQAAGGAVTYLFVNLLFFVVFNVGRQGSLLSSSRPYFRERPPVLCYERRRARLVLPRQYSQVGGRH